MVDIQSATAEIRREKEIDRRRRRRRRRRQKKPQGKNTMARPTITTDRRGGVKPYQTLLALP